MRSGEIDRRRITGRLRFQIARMPFGRFLILSAIGCLISSGLLAWLGSLLGDHYKAVEHYAGPVSTGIVAAAFLLWLVRLVLQFVRPRG